MRFRIFLFHAFEQIERRLHQGLEQARSHLFPTCHHHSTHYDQRAFYCEDCGNYRSRQL